jgi:hypothetical protein
MNERLSDLHIHSHFAAAINSAVLLASANEVRTKLPNSAAF